MRAVPFVLAVIGATGCGSSQPEKATARATATTTVPTVVPVSEAKWDQLNPARGDQSPKAATLWGDRNGRGPTGFLFHPVDGFSSPPHIHNVSYRGIVIRGLVHNDDPNAAKMWMPAGSFWTQPKGAIHVTAAKGENVLAYIEIDEGPYLVQPSDRAFATEEAPINLDESNIVWLNPSAGDAEDGPKVAYLWGNPQNKQPSGALVKLAAGSAGIVRSHGSLHAVVIQGRPKHGGRAKNIPLEPGSYFSSEGPSSHQLSCGTTKGCSLYVRAAGRIEVMRSRGHDVHNR